MPTINLHQDVYEQLQELMADKLKKKLEVGDIKVLTIIKSKYGITYSGMIKEMMEVYKKN